MRKFSDIPEFILDEYLDQIANMLSVKGKTNALGLELDFDMGYYMPKEDSADNGMLFRAGAAKELDMADLEFNYKMRGENFVTMHQNDDIFDAGDYDKYKDGLAVQDTTGYNFTVEPKIMEDLDSTLFYGSVDEAGDNWSKFKADAEMPVLIDGLTVNGSYSMIMPKDNNTVGSDDTQPAEENENTMVVGAEYEMNDYLSADFEYENISNLDHIESFNNEDMTQTTMSYGVEATEYPVFGNLTASAGYNYEKIDGYEYSDEYDNENSNFNNDTAASNNPVASSLEETITKYNLGLGYTMGNAEFNYDFTNKNVEGAGASAPAGEGTYTTNKVGMTYTIVEDTDFTADYEVLELVDDNDNQEYKVETATAGVSISF